MSQRHPDHGAVHGAGLGLRRALLGELEDADTTGIDFLEAAPENWIGVGGRYGKRLRACSERWPMLCHGLSLSLGGLAPLDDTLLLRLRRFLDQHRVRIYSEHLSYCSDDGHLYDLMPIPFTEAAVHHVAERIDRVQEKLGRRIAIENVSFYAPLATDMSEPDFVRAVLAQADCDLLLDVNNVYVNAANHNYDALDFIATLPSERIAYLHVAGHFREADDLIVDSHGAAVIDPVWQLLDHAYACHGLRPTLLERDFNIPPLPELLAELEHIRAIQFRHMRNGSAANQAAARVDPSTITPSVAVATPTTAAISTRSTRHG